MTITPLIILLRLLPLLTPLHLPPLCGPLPLCSGATQQSPRTDMYGDVDMLIDGEWKVMGLTQSACWAGPHYPNGTVSPNCAASACGNTPCLYNVYADPTEHNVSCPLPRLA